VVVTLLELTKQDKDEIINQEKRWFFSFSRARLLRVYLYGFKQDQFENKGISRYLKLSVIKANANENKSFIDEVIVNIQIVMHINPSIAGYNNWSQVGITKEFLSLLDK
jgi:hypothetical protein